MRSVDLRALYCTNPVAAYVGCIANSRAHGGVDLDGDVFTLTSREWVEGIARLARRSPQIGAPILADGGRELQRFFETGLRANGPGAWRELTAVAIDQLRTTPTGRALLDRFHRVGGEIEAVTDEEFKRVFGSDFAAAGCTRTADGRPLLLIANVFGGDPKGIASVIAHEMTHGLVQPIVDAMLRSGPTPAAAASDTVIWNETIAGTIQAKVELELGLQPGNLAANPDGTLRTHEETARAIRLDPTYSKMTADATQTLRWPLSVAGEAIVRLL